MDPIDAGAVGVPARNLRHEPLDPPGLPYGDSAALAKVDGNSGGLIFFIDGDKACTPMPVPETLLSMMDDVATAKISHEGNGL
jgi:hypothetical protein